MNKDKIIDYVLNTPGNTNPSILSSMLESYGGSNINVPKMQEVFCQVVNDSEAITIAPKIIINYLIIDENNNLVTVEKEIDEQGETICCIPSPVYGFYSAISMNGASISVELKNLNGEDPDFERTYLEGFGENFWGIIYDDCQLIFHVVVY